MLRLEHDATGESDGGAAMMSDLIQAWPTALAAFLASAVEFVEALTVVLAVGIVRGWRGAIAGASGALACLAVIVAALGPALTRLPLGPLQLGIGALLVLFGLRWLRKAILRAAGVIPLHDEAAAFAKQSASLRDAAPSAAAWDPLAVGTAFEITMLEGLEVVFIVVAMGAGGAGLLLPAAGGALAALALVVAVGLAVRGPLSSVPENALKFGVGVLLSGFGTFWVGEGIGLGWPGADLSILWLCLGYLAVALAAVPLCRLRARAAGRADPRRPPVKRGPMPWIRTAAGEVFGLFVDDGGTAAAILFCLGLAWIVLPRLSGLGLWRSALPFAALAAVLVVSAARRARR